MKINCWGRREPVGLSIESSIQTVQFRFDGFLVQLAGPAGLVRFGPDFKTMVFIA